ncbi:hypothetical protein HU230_0011695 [Bradyrhizobium quebecense]|uniref:Uncharacterized protein n=1 Tax=Bradyrhizobium quebecense TaxID=2748629 RepID=A0A973WRK1_9BRAD|nr:hypothetical protein [Bradyrhizobium quebecense]UGA46657.1 hypothetical protein HU230_0011695 [Bradyrhizobium quebecense]
MASSFLDVCRFNPTAGGTTDWTYSTPVTGYQSPAAAGAVNGAIYSYRAESADLSQWEVGFGAYNTGTGVLSRTTVLFNSAGTTAKINFSAAPQVAVVALAEDLLLFNAAMSLTVAQKAKARSNLSAGAFSAHKNGTDQTGVASGTYTKVTFGTKLYDVDNTFDAVTNSRWTPPAGIVLIDASVWVTGTWPAGTPITAVIYKNGVAFRGGFIDTGLANDGVGSISMTDSANGTDYYELFCQVNTTSGTATFKGNTTWTWIMGTVL